MSVKILNNYAAAAMHDGQIALAIRLAREALEKFRAEGSWAPAGLVTCSEVLYAAGDLQHAAELLREFHAIQRSDSTTVQAVEQEHRLSMAAVGIPVGIMLADAPLLKLNRDPTLLDLGFARNAQWLWPNPNDRNYLVYPYPAGDTPSKRLPGASALRTRRCSAGKPSRGWDVAAHARTLFHAQRCGNACGRGCGRIIGGVF
jgi:hypothetical protein